MTQVQRSFTMADPVAGGSATVGSAASANLPRQTPAFGMSAVNALQVGQQRAALPLPANGPVTTYNIAASNLKRGRVDNNVGGDASIRRTRANIGGTSDRDMAAMGSTILGTNAAPIQFGNQLPSIFNVQPGIDGGPTFGGFGPVPYDEAYRNTGPVGAASGPGMLAGFPAKPTYFNTQRSVPTQFSHTASSARFQPSQSNGTAVGGSSDPIRSFDMQQTSENTTRSNKTGGHAPRIKHTFTLAAETAQLSANELTAMPLIHEVTHLAPANGDQVSYGLIGAPSPGVRIWDIVTANWLMATEQPAPQTIADVITAQEMMTKYRIIGSGASDEGHQYAQGGRERMHALTQRNIVANLGGEALQVWNFWGEIPYAQRVGFILKGVPIDSIWAFNPRQPGSYNLSANHGTTTEQLDSSAVAKVLLQFVPWMSKASGDTPKYQDLLYHDDFGVARLGIWIPFGTVLQTHGQLGNQDDIQAAPFSIAAAHRTGKLTMIISRKAPTF
jgi:hypothetical protein